MGKKKKKRNKRKKRGSKGREMVYDYDSISRVSSQILEGIDDILNSDVVINLDSNGCKILYDLLGRVEGIINGSSVILEDMEQDPHYIMDEDTIKILKGLNK